MLFRSSAPWATTFCAWCASEDALKLQKVVAQGAEQIVREAARVYQEAARVYQEVEQAVSSARRASEGAIRLQERLAREARPGTTSDTQATPFLTPNP